MKNQAYKKLDKAKKYSIYLNVTEQIKAINGQDDEKVFVYVEGDKIIIERAQR